MIDDAIQLGWRNSLEPPFLGTYTEWCEQNLILVGSALTQLGNFDPHETPWVIEVLNDCDPRRRVLYNTFVKPVQSAGSVVGEAAIVCWLFFLNRGDIQYNWETDDKAKDRWKKRFEKILMATRKILDMLPDDSRRVQTCLIVLEKLNFTMQGVESDSNLASDSICAQVNEEIHNWAPGKLALAYGRTTAYQSSWFHILNISNAGMNGDQLHKAMENGTNQAWQVRCPNPQCNQFHIMRTEWRQDEAEFGGLRYDSTGCKRADGSYDYNRLAGTIRNQMPCGYPIHRLCDREYDLKIRRAISQTGTYTEPRNTGALLSNRSRTLEAVSVHYIDPLQLVIEKHDALKALRYGDPSLWKRYCKERECRFVDPDETPIVHEIKIHDSVIKSRDGLPGRSHRFFALDRQRGRWSVGEYPHWWFLIADIGMTNGKLVIQIIFEGKVQRNEEVLEILKEHGFREGDTVSGHHHGVADCSWEGSQPMEMQNFCLRNGINALISRGEHSFLHNNGVRRPYAQERPLHSNVGAPPRYRYNRAWVKGSWIETPDDREPRWWFYSADGVKEILYFLQNAPDVQIIIPSDVSIDFRKHMEAWQREPKKMPDGSIEMVWHQRRDRDDLYICLTYIAMLMHMAGLVGGWNRILTEKSK